jgi:hypothetical protein
MGFSVPILMAAASSAVSAVGAIAAGESQRQTAYAQARQAELQAKSDALKYKQQGIAVLEKTLATAATIRARAAAGSVDPFGGSALALTQYAFGKGVEEKIMTEDNAQIALLGGQINASEMRRQGDAAAQAGYIKAFGTLLSTGAQIQGIGWQPTGLGSSSLNLNSTGANVLKRGVYYGD